MDEHDALDRPRWLTDDLLEQAQKVFQPKSSVPFGETDAIEVLVSLSQLLDLTDVLKLEMHNETEEEIHRLGEG